MRFIGAVPSSFHHFGYGVRSIVSSGLTVGFSGVGGGGGLGVGSGGVYGSLGVGVGGVG